MMADLEHLGSVFRGGLAIYERARAFAIKAHLNQMRGETFYTCHLEQVEDVLIRFDHCSFRMRAAACLHDTVETPHVSMKDINREFPGFIASLVDAVRRVPGQSRDERNSAMYRSIKEHGINAIVLKLADRIANVEEAIRVSGDALSIYADEYTEFRDALYESTHAEAMWAHLDMSNEIGAESLTGRNLTAFASGVSLEPSAIVELRPLKTGSASHIRRRVPKFRAGIQVIEHSGP